MPENISVCCYPTPIVGCYGEMVWNGSDLLVAKDKMTDDRLTKNSVYNNQVFERLAVVGI